MFLPLRRICFSSRPHRTSPHKPPVTYYRLFLLCVTNVFFFFSFVSGVKKEDVKNKSKVAKNQSEYKKIFFFIRLGIRIEKTRKKKVFFYLSNQVCLARVFKSRAHQ